MWLLQVEQQEEQNKDAADDVVADGSPSEPSSSSPKSPKDKAAKAAPEATPKQGQEAETGAAGEGRVMGNGKQGGLTETEGRSTGKYWIKPNPLDPTASLKLGSGSSCSRHSRPLLVQAFRVLGCGFGFGKGV